MSCSKDCWKVRSSGTVRAAEDNTTLAFYKAAKRFLAAHQSCQRSRHGIEAGRASGSGGSGTSLSLQARVLGGWQDEPALGAGMCAAADQDYRLCIHVMKAGTPEGLSEPKSYWHITTTLQGQFACGSCRQGTSGV